jgi:WD40 repeat protein
MAEFNRRSAFCDAIFSPDGRLVAAYNCLEEKVFVLDSATGEIKTSRELGPAARPSGGDSSTLLNLTFSPDGKRLFLRGSNAVLYLDLDLKNNTS